MAALGAAFLASTGVALAGPVEDCGPQAQPAPITPGNYRSGRIESRHFFGLVGK